MPVSNTQTTSYSNPPANWQTSTNDLQTSQDAASTTRQPLYSSSSDTDSIAPGPAQPENAFTDYDSVSNFNSVSTNVQDPAQSVENQPYSNQEFYSSQYNDSYGHQNAEQQPDSTGNTEELQSSNYASDSQSSNVERSIPENDSAYDSQSDQRPSKAASTDNTQPVTSEWKKYHTAWQSCADLSCNRKTQRSSHRRRERSTSQKNQTLNSTRCNHSVDPRRPISAVQPYDFCACHGLYLAKHESSRREYYSS